MRSMLFSLALGTATLAFVVIASPGRAAGDHGGGRGRQATMQSSPGARAGQLVPQYPPTTPYRSPFFFPGSHNPAREREVVLYDNYFSPNTLWVQAGTEVRFVNQGRHHHTATCDWVWESGDLAPKKTFSLTFTRTGTYTYYCRHHTEWMRGTVTVY